MTSLEAIESAVAAVQGNPNTFWRFLKRKEIEAVRCRQDKSGWEVWLRGRPPAGGELFIYRLKLDLAGNLQEASLDTEANTEFTQTPLRWLNLFSRWV